MIKIDVEGYEYHVFKGAETLLSGHEAPDILFEFVDWAEDLAKDISIGDAQRLLKSCGYRIFYFSENKKVLDEVKGVLVTGSYMLYATKNLKVSMQQQDKIYIAGHRGMVGSAITRRLQKEGFTNLVSKTSAELDLKNQVAVQAFFEKERPDYVFLAAAKVGGIMANNIYRGEFLYDNLMIQSNTIDAAYRSGVKKLMFLGSSCIYPKMAPQPLKEEYMLTGLLEPTNEPYAIAKIAGIKMCDAYRSQYGCNFISVMPTNLFGPNDNYDLNTSHVLPALIHKFHEAKMNNAPFVTIWGSGKPAGNSSMPTISQTPVFFSCRNTTRRAW